MARSIWVAIVLAALAGSARAQAPVVTAAVTTAATSETARDVLAHVRPAIIQIKGFFGSNTAQAFHGTGFAVAPGGIFITNYHVVAEQVQHPGKYTLGYRTTDGATGTISILAIDVLHDLALVRASSYAPEPLELARAVPSKGVHAYSIGYPLDVGLSITEGVSNGKVDDSFEARIHYSGAINGGMSGGPALDSSGVVIGVNVSGYRFEQLVSFLVPAEHALALITKPRAPEPVAAADLKKTALDHLHQHSVDLLGALAGPMTTQVTSAYRLPAKLAPFVDCNATGNTATEQPVQTVTINCASKAGLYLQQGLYSGDLRFAHYILTSDKLDAWRFTHRLSGMTAAHGVFGTQRHVGPYACEQSVVALKGFDASLAICTRNYRKLDGLYDFVVRVSSLNGTSRGFASHLDMYGLEFDAGMAFIRRYVEAMEYAP